MTALRLVLMCGPSFSGKSTVARALAERLDATVVSYDALNEQRGLLGGQGIPVEEWIATHRWARIAAVDALRGGVTVIVDDTSSRHFLRDEWREIARQCGAEFILIRPDADEATIRARLAANRRDPHRHDVTDDVLTEHLASFEWPGADEQELIASPADIDAIVARLT